MRVKLLYLLIIMGLESTLISKSYVVLAVTLSLTYEFQRGMIRDCLSYLMFMLRDFTYDSFLESD